MNPTAARPVESALSARYAAPAFPNVSGVPTVLIVAADRRVHETLTGILEGQGVETESVIGFEAAKSLLATGGIDACLCGFRLEDGSYRDLVKYTKRQMPEIPVVIVSTPGSPNEYGEYLAAMNAGAFDFLCHPYEKREVERILRLAVSSSRRVAR
jgi:DNA-binding NtrC family response regulator